MREDGGGVLPPEGLAPVIPLFGDAAPAARANGAASGWNATWADETDDDESDESGIDDCTAIERELAERNLLRKLRTRSLSLREARAVVTERDLTADGVEAVLHDFIRRGYLDDKSLAEQLVHSAIDRKGQGRQVIAQTLAKRGIPREVIDAVISELPDDDADRALEFARGKARSMSTLDHDTALRRLAGQLARRGYGGSTAFTAARAALDEVATARSPRVTFRDS